MTPRQIAIIKEALDNPEALDEWQQGFVDSLCSDGDTPDKYKILTDTQDAKLEEIAEELGV